MRISIIKYWLLLLPLWPLGAQTDSSARAEKRPVPRPWSLRVGYDIGKKIWASANGGQIDQAYLWLSYGNHLVEITGGRESMPYRHTTYGLQATGYYIKVGYHYNFYENWGNMRNEITWGIRYAQSRFGYDLQYLDIRYPGPEGTVYHWEGHRYSPPVTARWLETVVTVKAELKWHIYLDLFVAGKWIPRIPQVGYMEAVYIPGFYETNVSHFGFGLGYGVSYRFGY